MVTQWVREMSHERITNSCSRNEGRTSLDRDRRISSSFRGAVAVKNKSKRVMKLMGGCGGQDTLRNIHAEATKSQGTLKKKKMK